MIARLAAAAALLALAGCADFAPYSTVPATAEAGTKDAGPRVAICYDTLVSTLAEVHKAAQEQCPAGSVAQPADTDWYVQHCPLLLPARATFVCTPRR